MEKKIRETNAYSFKNAEFDATGSVCLKPSNKGLPQIASNATRMALNATGYTNFTSAKASFLTKYPEKEKVQIEIKSIEAESRSPNKTSKFGRRKIPQNDVTSATTQRAGSYFDKQMNDFEGTPRKL